MPESLKPTELKPGYLVDFVKENTFNFLGIYTSAKFQDLDYADVEAALRDMSVYDGQIRGHLALRAEKACNFPWSIQGGSESMRALCSQIFERMKANMDLLPIWRGVPFGRSLTEINWTVSGGRWVPESFTEIEFERVRFDENYNPLILADNYSQLLLPRSRRKYLLMQYDRQGMDPYGMPLLAAVYWLRKAKRDGIGLWVRLMDRFSVPELVAMMEASGNTTLVKEQLDAVTEELKNLRQGGVGAIANVKDLKTFSVDGQGDDFKMFFKWVEDEISFAILGSNLTTSEGSAGSRALGEVHADTSKAMYAGDARYLAKVLNEQLFRYITDLNEGAASESPQIVFDVDGTASWQQVIDAIDRGIPVGKEEIYQRFQIPRPKSESDSFTAEKTSGGAALSDRPFGCTHSPTGQNPKPRGSNEWIARLTGSGKSH